MTELRCTADLESKTGGATSSRKVKGTIHWVSAAHAIDAEVRLYDRLFTVAEPDADRRFQDVHQSEFAGSGDREMRARAANARPEERYQFERLGYFALDPDSTPGKTGIWNRTITLKDTWAKEVKKDSSESASVVLATSGDLTQCVPVDAGLFPD